MPVRSSRLPKNHSAGCVDAIPLRTVHQSPPKKMAPSDSSRQPSQRQHQRFIHRCPPGPPASPCLPWPPNATHSNSRSRARPSTAPASRTVLPGWRRSNQRPSAAPSSVGTTTDQPISPIMPRPNQTSGVAFRRALSLRAAFAPICAAKVGAFFGVFCGLVTHGESSRSGGQSRLPISP